MDRLPGLRWRVPGGILLVLASGCSRPAEGESRAVAPLPPTTEVRTPAEKKVLVAHRAALNAAVEEKSDPSWQKASGEVGASREREGRPPLAELVRGPHRKTVLLSFDDGPHPVSTPRLLEILKEESVPATFFVIGRNAERWPDLLRAIKAGGHTIANHTFSHVTLTKLPPLEVRTEYRAAQDVVRRITGVTMRFCRPPGGDVDSNVIQAAQAEGLTTILWTDDPGDFTSPGDVVVLDRTVRNLSDGAVILLHDGSPNTIDVLREIIHEAKARGYAFTTPERMVEGLEGRVSGRKRPPGRLGARR